MLETVEKDTLLKTACAGEDPLLVGALRHAVGLLQEEEAHLQEGATRHAGDLLLAGCLS